MANRLMMKLMTGAIILAWGLAACGLVTAPQPGTLKTDPATVSAPASTATAKPEKVVSLATPQATETAASAPTETAEVAVPSARGGYLIFDGESGEFQAYQADGSLAYTIPAAGVNHPSGFTTAVVDGAVYYLPENGTRFVRATPNGVKDVDIPANFMSKIRISPDERYIAWSMFDTNGSSALWMAEMDENQNILEPREVARYSFEQSEAFSLSPIEWTSDGQLLFERGLTGIGGYILYAGHNSLYSYDPAADALVTLIPAEENHGLCLESYRPDLDKVLFHCSKEGQEIVIRELNGYTNQRLPALPEQGTVGSAHFSPSGERLAYAVARNNPDNESGEVVVAPADLSSTPVAIASVADNTYPAVLGWLDEDTLLFARSQWPTSTLYSVRYDGSQVEQRVDGWFLGWIR